MNKRGGIAKIFISECLGAVTPRKEAKQLCIEGYRCLHGSPTENFRTVSSWDSASDFGMRQVADNLTAEHPFRWRLLLCSELMDGRRCSL